MTKIVITPYYRPRRYYVSWAGEFEILPTIQALRQAVSESLAELISGMKAGTVEDTEETQFLRDYAYPKCIQILEVGKLPTLIVGKTTISTTYQDSRTYGSIAIHG